jgi:hypothetical protein
MRQIICRNHFKMGKVSRMREEPPQIEEKLGLWRLNK